MCFLDGRTMKDRFNKTWPVLLAGALFFVAGWHGQGGVPSAAGDRPDAATKSHRRPLPALTGKGSALIPEWRQRLDATGDADLGDLAKGLISDPRRGDLALWGALLARWSVADGAGMIAFLEADAPPGLRPRLLDLAWFAWGASDPEAAFAAGRKLPPERIRKLLEGVVETDPRKAAAFVEQVPDSQFARYTLAGRIVSEAPELADEMLADAVYDGARIPFQRAKVAQLAASDPAAAVDYARVSGLIGSDPVPVAIQEIARHDPAKAAVEVAAMPSSRSKALSSVALAKIWAARDSQAAVRWIHENLEGPVRHHALVAAAEASGADDPVRGLDLIVEAGFESGGDFFGIRGGDIHPSETRSKPDAVTAATDLLRQLSQRDPEAARRYLQDEIPEEMRSEFKPAIEP